MISLAVLNTRRTIMDAINSVTSMHEDIRLTVQCDSFDCIAKDKSHRVVDVLIIDCSLNYESACQNIRKLKTINNSLKVLVVSGLSDEDHIRKFFKSGASGYLLKNSENELEKAIRTISSGEYYFGEEIVKIVMSGLTDSSSINAKPLKILTKRELEILDLIVDGYTSKQIGKKLFIAESTVYKHRRNIIFKTGVSSSRALSKYVYEHKMIF